MDWKLVALIPLIMWAVYSVFGSLSSNAHGTKVTVVVYVSVEAIFVSCWLLLTGTNEFKSVTRLSMLQAIIMGLGAVLGLFAQLYAFRVAPADKQGVVAMLGGMFPVLAVVFFYLMYRLNIFGGSPMAVPQWLGVFLTAVGLWLVSK